MPQLLEQLRAIRDEHGWGWMLILAYAVQGLLYLIGLFFLGELTWDEVVGYGAQFRSRR